MADEKQTFTVAGYKFATKEEAQHGKQTANLLFHDSPCFLLLV